MRGTADAAGGIVLRNGEDEVGRMNGRGGLLMNLWRWRIMNWKAAWRGNST